MFTKAQKLVVAGHLQAICDGKESLRPIVLCHANPTALSQRMLRMVETEQSTTPTDDGCVVSYNRAEAWFAGLGVQISLPSHTLPEHGSNRSASPTSNSTLFGLSFEKYVVQCLSQNLIIIARGFGVGLDKYGAAAKWDIVAVVPPPAPPMLLWIEAKSQGGRGSAEVKWRDAIETVRENVANYRAFMAGKCPAFGDMLRSTITRLNHKS